MPSKEPESVEMPATTWDRKPMEYVVMQPTGEDGTPESAPPAAKAAATRLAHTLTPAGTSAGGKQSGQSVAVAKEN